jgi:heme oxygenase
MNANELAEKIIEPDCFREYIIDAANMLSKQAEEIEYWKSAFERSMSLYDQVKHLEAQVYGGTTK